MSSSTAAFSMIRKKKAKEERKNMNEHIPPNLKDLYRNFGKNKILTRTTGTKDLPI